MNDSIGQFLIQSHRWMYALMNDSIGQFLIQSHRWMYAGCLCICSSLFSSLCKWKRGSATVVFDLQVVFLYFKDICCGISLNCTMWNFITSPLSVSALSLFCLSPALFCLVLSFYWDIKSFIHICFPKKTFLGLSVSVYPLTSDTVLFVILSVLSISALVCLQK